MMTISQTSIKRVRKTTFVVNDLLWSYALTNPIRVFRVRAQQALKNKINIWANPILASSVSLASFVFMQMEVQQIQCKKQKCKIGKSYQNKLNHFVPIKYVFCIKSDLAYKQLQNLLSTFLAFAKHQSLQRTMTATALLYLFYAKKKKIYIMRQNNLQNNLNR